MKQKKLINIQSNLRNKFIKKGVKIIAPETVFFSKDIKADYIKKGFKGKFIEMN